MIYEVVIQTVDPEHREDHVKNWRQAWEEADFDGFREGTVLTSVEDPSRVIVLLGWDSVEAHTRHRGTPAHNRFREQIGTYQTAPTVGGHYLIEEL